MSVSSIAERLYRVEKIEVPLYHCTSLAGLMGIVDSQSLFATDMRYFNDSQGLHAVSCGTRHCHFAKAGANG
jgi:hypothetical protein